MPPKKKKPTKKSPPPMKSMKISTTGSKAETNKYVPKNISNMKSSSKLSK